jgi:hypothetical protein
MTTSDVDFYKQAYKDLARAFAEVVRTSEGYRKILCEVATIECLNNGDCTTRVTGLIGGPCATCRAREAL